MKVSTIAAAALVALPCLAAAEPAAHYPAGSLARRLFKEVWGRGAFGGKVGQQEWPQGDSPLKNDISDEEEDTTTTITKTAVVTVTKTRSTTAGATPAAKVKRSAYEEPSAALSNAEEAAFLNDIFTLDLFKAGTPCNPAFQREVCSGNSILVCSESHSMWEKSEDCAEKKLKCGATGAQDGSNEVTIMCLSNNLIDYPENRPSEKIKDQIQAVINN